MGMEAARSERRADRLLTREQAIGGRRIRLYAESPAGPWVSNPADLAVYRERVEMQVRGTINVTWDGKPMTVADRGRDHAIRSRRAKAAHAKRRRLLG